MRDWLHRTLVEMVPRDHRQSARDLRRRQIVTSVFAVIGAVVLAFSLNIEPGSALFYPATASLAAVWTIGAFACGPLHLGRIMHATAPRWLGSSSSAA